MAQEKSNASAEDSRIAVHWHEENYISPPEFFVKQANLTDPSIFDRFSLDNAEQLGVNIFHTSPTAVRALRQGGTGRARQA